MYYEVLNTNVRFMGSLHLIPANIEKMPEWVFEAYEWSESIVFESDPHTILSHISEKESSNWHKLLSAPSFDRLKKQWISNDDIPVLEKVHPWAAMLFSQVFSMPVTEGVEGNFLRMSEKNSKPVQFLETAQEVAKFFSSIPISEIIKSLENLAMDLSAPQKVLESMYEAWARKDINALYNIASKTHDLQLPVIYQAVLSKRNVAWLPALQELMISPSKTLIAVGALHLHGPGNVIELLNKDIRYIKKDS